MKSTLLPPALLHQLLSTVYECCEYDKDAITEFWPASEPFALREMYHGSTNTSEPVKYDCGDGASFQSSGGDS